MDHALSRAELDIVLDITFLFNSVLDIKLLSGRFLQMLGKLVPYEKAAFFLYHPTRQRLVPCAEIRCERALLEEYAEKYHAMDYLGWMFYQTGIGTARESDKISKEERQGTIFFKSFMKKYDIAYRLFFVIESGEGEILGGGMLLRSNVFEDFSEHEMTILQMLRQNFAAAVENSLRFEQLKHSGALAQKVYRDITDAMLVLNGALEIKDSNQQMKKFLEAIQQEKGEDSFLETVRAACVQLRQEPGAGDVATSVTVKVYHGTAKISMISTGTLLGEDPYEFVVVYSDASSPQPPGPAGSAEEQEADREKFIEILGRQYGLTKRELNLVELALDGLENREIAERLHISLFTVKSHFQNSYAKLGVKNRQELFLLYMNYNVSEGYRQQFEAGTRKDELW